MRSLTLVAVIAVPVFAQTVYTWEDEDGLHYTDDLSQVPKQQKKVEGVVIDARPASSGLVAPRPTPTTVAVADPKLTEYEWRDRFIGAHRRVATLKQSIAALEASLPPRTECIQQQPVTMVTGGGAPVVPAPAGTIAVGTPGGRQRLARCQVNPLHDQLRVQIAQQRVELGAAEAELEQLDRRASMEAVPREWRRGW